MTSIRAWAARTAGGLLEPYEFDPGPLSSDQIEIAVEHCGICYSDIAMIDGDLMPTQYPLVPGHEVVGRVVEIGADAKGFKIDQCVGVGWYADSCSCCQYCSQGEHNLCTHRQPTIVGRHGGFAERIRVHWNWAIPLPDTLNFKDSGPLLCGGLTVFNPLLIHGVKPTDRIGVVGIGGLGHMALKFSRS